MPQLFGVFAYHSPESCPLNNKESRATLLQIDDKLKANMSKYRISRIVGFYL